MSKLLSEMHAKASALLELIGEDVTAFNGDVEGHLRVAIAHLEHVVSEVKPALTKARAKTAAPVIAPDAEVAKPAAVAAVPAASASDKT